MTYCQYKRISNYKYDTIISIMKDLVRQYTTDVFDKKQYQLTGNEDIDMSYRMIAKCRKEEAIEEITDLGFGDEYLTAIAEVIEYYDEYYYNGWEDDYAKLTQPKKSFWKRLFN